MVSNDKICKIEDNTYFEEDYEKIARQDTLKGIFIRNMLKEIENNPDKKEIAMKAIEYVLH